MIALVPSLLQIITGAKSCPILNFYLSIKQKEERKERVEKVKVMMCPMIPTERKVKRERGNNIMLILCHFVRFGSFKIPFKKQGLKVVLQSALVL